MEMAPQPSGLLPGSNAPDPLQNETPAADVAAEQNEPFVDGFSWRTIIGALFIGLIMMPGAIYLSLIAGQGLGPAAEWVTIILFMEVARRSYQTLAKQELYLLYYAGASLTSQVGALALTGGPFANLIMTQYIVRSPYAQAYNIQAPSWVVPSVTSPANLERSFFHADWLPAIGLLMFGQIFGRLQAWGLGYVMFRITSDLERLPFPLAPIAAEGATALAESSSQQEGWRWRIFSIGAMIGVGWGAIYVLLPQVTSILFNGNSIVIVPNPFIDLTASTQNILPAALSGIGTDLGTVMIGFVLPWAVVLGTFIGSIGAHIVANPFLQANGYLPNWTRGTNAISAQISNNFDFWLSFTIGTAIVVAFIGIASVVRALSKQRAERRAGGINRLTPPEGRGDISIWFSLAAWFVGTVAFIAMCHYLVPDFNLGILIFFGFVWTPIFSYINARMSGLAGTSVSIPYVREASFMMSGYTKSDIWFAPIPLNDFGYMAQHFRTVELTRTKFTSIVKIELVMIPIMLICSLIFWSFIWRLAPIPSANYPYAATFWPPHAQTQAMWMTGNRPGEGNVLKQAINLNYIGAGGLFAGLTYVAITLSGLPILLFYGLIGGIQGQPYAAIPMMIGALLGRYYFEKRYGQENWRSYAPVLTAGYFCGMGLIGMGAVSLALLSKSVQPLPF